MRVSRLIPRRTITGGVILVYWEANETLPGGGAYVVCGGKGLAPRFDFWADIGNPISQMDADMARENQIVTNAIPVADDMPLYLPSEGELRNRETRRMLDL